MKKIFKAFFTVTAISVATRFISFIFKIYISRKLGAEIMGVYQICLSVFMLFVSLAASGLPVTLSRFTAETQATGNIRRQRASVSTALLLSLMISITVCTVFYCFPSLLNYIFTDKRCADLFIILLPTMITTSVYTISRGWFWGKKDFFIFSVTEAADELIKIIMCGILISCLGGVIALEYSLAYAMLISDVVIAVTLAVLFFVKGGRLASPTLSKPIIKSATPLTVTRMCGSVMSTFISLVLPSILIASCNLTSAQATAEFGRATGMVMPLILAPSSVIGSLSVVIIPEIAARNASSDTSINRTLTKALNFTCIVASAAFIVFAGCGETIGTLLYDDTAVGSYLAAASAIVFPISINGIVVSMLNSFGKENQTFISHVIGYVFLVAAILILPRYTGIYGYFISIFIFHTITMIANLAFLGKRVPLTARSSLKCLMPVGLSLIIAIGVRIMSKAIMPIGEIAACAISMICGAIILYIALALLKMAPTPKAALKMLRK
ncbi:MAG: oligosaccharide flippase family protein [Clostridia bacterium]|nr:oligosaccharide flippase family protein [Clostridia bacterium]